MIKILLVSLLCTWSIEMIVAATIRDSRGTQKKDPPNPQAQYDLRKVSGRSRSYYNLDQSRSKRTEPTVALLLAVNPQLTSKKSKNQNNNIHKVYVKPQSIEDSYDRSELSEYTPVNRVIGKKLIQQLIDRGEIKRVEELTLSEEQAEKKRIDSKYDELLQIFHSISDKKSKSRNHQTEQKVKLKKIPYFDSYEDSSEEDFDEYDDRSDNIRIDYNKYLDNHKTIANNKKPYIFGYNISKDDLQKSSSNLQKNRDSQTDSYRESSDNFDPKTFDEKNVKTILKQLEQIDPHKGAQTIEYPKKGYKNSKPKDENIHKVKFNIAKLIEHELEKLYNLECECQQKGKPEDQYGSSMENLSADLSDDIENSENVSRPQKPDSEKKIIETALNSNDISENLKLNENQLYSEIPDKTRVERYGEISTNQKYEKKPRLRGVYTVSKPNRIGSYIDDLDRYVTYLEKPKDQTFRSSSKKVRRHQTKSDEDESNDTKTDSNKYDLHDNTSERNKRDYSRSSRSRSSRYYTKIRRPRSSSSNTGSHEADGTDTIPVEIIERQKEADPVKEHQQKEPSGRSPRAGTPHNSNPTKNGNDEAAIPDSVVPEDAMRFIQLYRNAHENILEVFNHFGHEPTINKIDNGLADDELSSRASIDDHIVPASPEQTDALTYDNNFGINREELVKELSELVKNANRKRENSDSGNEPTAEVLQRAEIDDESELANDEVKKPMVLNQNGLRIPLKVIQEEDGSFSLNLDYMQLCRRCGEHPVSVVPKRRRRPKTGK